VGLFYLGEQLATPIKRLTVYRDGPRNEQVLTTRMDNGLDEEGQTDE
jgi:ribonucleoside-diphosphate reductase alpha chain